MAHPAIRNFTVLDSIYGKVIVNRHCAHQAEYLIKTGIPHIQPELQNILAIANTLPANCVIVDAGANAGLVTLPLALMVRERGGVVYAFEVQRMMFYALCGSVALNDLENVHVSLRGLGSARETVSFEAPNYSIPQDFGQFSLKGDVAAPSATQGGATQGGATQGGATQGSGTQGSGLRESVEIIPLDDLALPRVDFFKIDVEGMEIKVLEGARKSIAAHQPWCWIEYWMQNIEDIKLQFAGLPYRFYKMDKLNLLCVPNQRVTEQMKISAEEV